VTSGIYRIDLGNGWFYIGSAVDLKRRESEHRRSLKRKDHANRQMQNCFNKYQIFNFVILIECSIDELLNREQAYLDTNFNHYKNVNLTPTAGSPLGYNHTADAKAKMSAMRKGKTLSAETKAKMSEAKRNISAQTRAKMSAASKGRIPSAETRAKLSAAAKAYYFRKAQAA
jgi:group I intron endonuclease